jgi:hypothetical protein
LSDLGQSPICDGSNDEHCVCVNEVDNICEGTNRADSALAFNGNSSCEEGDWSSTGINGYIALEIDDLFECDRIEVNVRERDGPNEEQYLIGLCESSDHAELSNVYMSEACVVLGIGQGSQGGYWVRASQ